MTFWQKWVIAALLAETATGGIQHSWPLTLANTFGWFVLALIIFAGLSAEQVVRWVKETRHV